MKEEGAASGGGVGIPNDSRKPLLPYPLALAFGLPFLFNFVVLLVSFVRSYPRGRRRTSPCLRVFGRDTEEEDAESPWPGLRGR